MDNEKLHECIEKILEICPPSHNFNCSSELSNRRIYEYDHTTVSAARQKIIDLGYAISVKGLLIILTRYGREAKEIGHEIYQQSLKDENESRKKQTEDFLFYQSEIGKGFANQGVLLLEIAEQISQLKNTNDPTVKTSKIHKIFEILSSIGVNVSSDQIGEFLNR